MSEDLKHMAFVLFLIVAGLGAMELLLAYDQRELVHRIVGVWTGGVSLYKGALPLPAVFSPLGTICFVLYLKFAKVI